MTELKCWTIKTYKFREDIGNQFPKVLMLYLYDTVNYAW